MTRECVLVFKNIKARAELLTRDIIALYLAYKDPRVPLHAKICALCVVAYALSPIDLIPDFIPVIGYLDDLLLVPLGIWISIRLIPAPILAECRSKAPGIRVKPSLPGRIGAVLVIALWVLIAILIMCHLILTT